MKHCRRLFVWALERRDAPAVFTVDESQFGYTLSSAISAANALPGVDEIHFASYLAGGTYVVTNEVAVIESVKIVGPALLSPGMPNFTIDAGGLSRVLNFGAPVGVATFDISGIRFVNGNGSYGGAITLSSVDDNVNLTDCVFDGNKSSNSGGAFGAPNTPGFPTLGSINITRCTFTNNATSLNFGGAVALDCSTAQVPTSGWKLNIVDSTFDGNSSASNGGAVFVRIPNALINFSRSTFSKNNSAGFGGGLSFLTSPGGSITFDNCTIAGNTASNSGSAVSNGGASSGKYYFNNCTIASNLGQTGGAIAVTSGSPQIRIESTILYGNSPTELSGGSVTAKNCLIGPAINPLLGPLQNNGGLTETMALLPGSPAINAGSNSANLATDQRGPSFARIGFGAPDIGAFELQSQPAKVSNVVINSTKTGSEQTQRSRVVDVAVTFDSKVSFVGGDANAKSAFTLNRVSYSTGSVTLAAAVDNSGTGTKVTLTFTGGMLDFNSLADGRYALHVLASQIASGLDGNSDGITGDDFAFDEPAAPAPLYLSKIFRLYGDWDADGYAGVWDFIIGFRLAYGGAGPYGFDFDNDGAIAASDLIQFRLRFGGSI